MREDYSESGDAWRYLPHEHARSRASGRTMNLKQVAREIGRRLTGIFLPDGSGRWPCHGDDRRYATDPAWRDLVVFYEYFHGDTGRGVGASHQTGWTALIARLLEDVPAWEPERRTLHEAVPATPATPLNAPNRFAPPWR